MSGQPIQMGNPMIPALSQAVAGGRDPRITQVVALADTMLQRGPADVAIGPLRQRLAMLHPPHSLSFGRLMFHPLDLVIVPAARWRRRQQSIPRTALSPMAKSVRSAMGAASIAIEGEIAGRTTADAELISRLGWSLWPVAAEILDDTVIPETWDATELGDMNYRPLADTVATLLAEAATLDALCADAATGLLPPGPKVIEAMLSRVVQTNEAALPMMIAMLLDRLPVAAELLPAAHTGPEAASVQAAMDGAADLLLRHLDQGDGTDTRVARGALADAGVTVGRIAALLRQLSPIMVKPRHRERLHAVRQRLEADCRARFASGLQDELLAPLQHLGIAVDIPALEAAARGLRVLATQGRVVGCGSTYDLLLGKAAEAIKDNAMRDRLSQVDQLRLVEILTSSDAALAMLDRV